MSADFYHLHWHQFLVFIAPLFIATFYLPNAVVFFLQKKVGHVFFLLFVPFHTFGDFISKISTCSFVPFLVSPAVLFPGVAAGAHWPAGAFRRV